MAPGNLYNIIRYIVFGIALIAILILLISILVILVIGWRRVRKDPASYSVDEYDPDWSDDQFDYDQSSDSRDYYGGDAYEQSDRLSGDATTNAPPPPPKKD